MQLGSWVGHFAAAFSSCRSFVSNLRAYMLWFCDLEEAIRGETWRDLNFVFDLEFS